ncbi:hypothetical protein SEVIR_9G359251v4 [Setaria viridis]
MGKLVGQGARPSGPGARPCRRGSSPPPASGSAAPPGELVPTALGLCRGAGGARPGRPRAPSRRLLPAAPQAGSPLRRILPAPAAPPRHPQEGSSRRRPSPRRHGLPRRCSWPRCHQAASRRRVTVRDGNEVDAPNPLVSEGWGI